MSGFHQFGYWSYGSIGWKGKRVLDPYNYFLKYDENGVLKNIVGKMEWEKKVCNGLRTVSLRPERPETVTEQADTHAIPGNLVKHLEGAAVGGFILRITDDKQPENYKPHHR